MKKTIILIIILSIFTLTGCGALLSILIQALVGTKVGFVFVAVAVTQAAKADEEKKSGMLLLFENNPPEGYVPLQGATVSIGDQSIGTGPDGSFKLENVPVGVKILRVAHPDYVSIQQEIVIDNPNAESNPFNKFKVIPPGLITIPLSKAEPRQASFNFEAYGIDPNNNPIKTATDWTVNNKDASIDNNGRFYTTKKGTYIVTGTSTVNPSLSDSVIVTVVERVIKVYGYVKDDKNIPIAGAYMTVAGNNQFANTDPNGYYEIPNIPSTEFITVKASSTSGSGSNTVTVTDPNVPLQVDIVLTGPPVVNPDDPYIPVDPDITPTPEPNSPVQPNTIYPETPSLISFSGAKFYFPPGSVTKPVTYNCSSSGITPALPPDVNPSGIIYCFEVSDSGAYLANRANIIIPVTRGGWPSIYYSLDGINWQNIAGEINGSTVIANMPGFPYFVIGESILTPTPTPELTPTPTQDPNVTPTQDPNATPTATLTVTPTPTLTVTPTPTLTPTNTPGGGSAPSATPTIYPILTAIYPSSDPTNSPGTIHFYLYGSNMGTTGEVRFTNLDAPTPSIATPTYVPTWTNDMIEGYIYIGTGKHLIRVTTDGKTSIKEIFYFKGSGSFPPITIN